MQNDNKKRMLGKDRQLRELGVFTLIFSVIMETALK